MLLLCHHLTLNSGTTGTTCISDNKGYCLEIQNDGLNIIFSEGRDISQTIT